MNENIDEHNWIRNQVGECEMHVDQIDVAKHDMVVDAYDVGAQTIKIRITLFKNVNKHLLISRV